MKHPFLFLGSILVAATIGCLGLSLMAEMLTVANTACNIASWFVALVVIAVDYHFLKFSCKKLI
jgi:hypothetical protein